MTYDCMTPEELALWRAQGARSQAKEPCVDCPLWFAREARARGVCVNTERWRGRSLDPHRLEQMRLATRRYRLRLAGVQS